MKTLFVVLAGCYLYWFCGKLQAAKARRNDRKRFYELYKINI